MPWTGQQFASRHNKALKGEKAEHAARIANATLRSGVPEGEAIAIASKWAKKHKRASGGPAPKVPTYEVRSPEINAQGFVSVPPGGTYGLDLRTGAMAPGSRDALQAYAQRGLPIAGMSPPAPAAPEAPALSQAEQDFLTAFGASGGSGTGSEGGGGDTGGGGGGFAGGGKVRVFRAAGGYLPQATPWWSKRQATAEHVPTGLIRGPTGGRQDAVGMNLPPHSHVIPADVVSGWGQGNTDAGAVALHHQFNSGPFGLSLPKVPARAQHFSAPRAPRLARGGERTGVKTLVSHGEMIVYPEGVQHIGKGDFDKGHDWLDRAIVDWRKQIVARQRKLPGPVKE